MISVVIPTHNRADLLSRAIVSVMNQTYKDIEIVVVSDGSTDNTKNVVEKFARDDARIRFIEYFPAKGGNIARNIGIEHSVGEYLAFLDDDDEWTPRKLEKQLNVLKNDSQIGLVYTGVNIIYFNEKIKYKFKSSSEGDLSKKILLDNYIGTTSTVMLKRELLDKTGTFDNALKALQDYDLWIRCCQYSRVGCVDECLVNYFNYTGKKQVSSFTDKYINAFNYINQKYSKYFLNLSENEKNIKLVNEYLLLANKAMRNGDSTTARKFLQKSFKIKFTNSGIVYWLFSFTNFKTILKLRSLKG